MQIGMKTQGPCSQQSKGFKTPRSPGRLHPWPQEDGSLPRRLQAGHLKPARCSHTSSGGSSWGRPPPPNPRPVEPLQPGLGFPEPLHPSTGAWESSEVRSGESSRDDECQVTEMSSESASARERSSSPGALRLPEGRRTRERSPSPMRGYLIPSPLPTRRTRTCSATTRASEGPTYKGVCKCFCRSKGHGFITPVDGSPDIFVHISDIEGEYVPVSGDEVTYKVCTIPPKNEKLQAVEVVITHLVPGTKHETWSGHVINS
ncbi:calcium-regulated heat-stable protein 1 isoform X2 [Rhineura floridana]|uniref:calcium-regulated heat-stable protein 1 isoform X2 n=1 Tax=Rhineura floridana TaxID=261503 RepID=UPI002AC837F3|nr:calcium-regulated heat-stable protein 1 isoform X2 [Rhineura floridana]